MNIDDTIASAITQREEEVAGYQFNITNFEMMLARLPTDWDAESIAVREREQITEAEALLIGLHKLRDDIRQRLISERVQMQTAQLVLDVLLARR
jgi:hypothetical protein